VSKSMKSTPRNLMAGIGFTPLSQKAANGKLFKVAERWVSQQRGARIKEDDKKRKSR
jgi:hypothetical protein